MVNAALFCGFNIDALSGGYVARQCVFATAKWDLVAAVYVCCRDEIPPSLITAKCLA